MKQFILLCSTLVSVAAAQAETTPYHSGFYVGAFQGMGHAQGKVQTTYTDPPTSKGGNFSPTQTSFLFGAHVGYRHFFDRGISAGFDIDLSKTDNVLNVRYGDRDSLGDSYFDVKIKRKYNIIPSFSLGYKIHNKFHVFGKMGLSLGKTRYSMRSIDEGQGIESVLVDKNVRSYAFVPAIGGEYGFNENWSVLLMFSYERFNKKLSVFPASNIGTDSFSTKAKENIYTQKIGLLYKF